MSSQRIWSSLLLLCIHTLVYAAPNNDNVATAIAITQLPYQNQQATTEATLETDELTSQCLTDVGATVWYRYTATKTETIILSTAESSYDTVLSVWVGNDHPLTEVDCNDDHANTSQSQVSITTQQGKSYFINVGGYLGEVGALVLNATAVTDSKNDHLANAQRIDTVPQQITQQQVSMSLEESEVLPSCQKEISSSMWYQYTATETATLSLDTLNSDFNTVLSVWTGDSHPLTELACNDDSNGVSSRLNFITQKNTTYYIQVGEAKSLAGENESNNIMVLTVQHPPVNDEQDNAFIIDGSLPYLYQQDTQGAGQSRKELTPSCATAGATVWYRYTANKDETLHISTENSAYDTVLSVWQQQADTWQELACNNDEALDLNGFPTANTARLDISVVKGESYYFAVSGAMENNNAATGNLTLQLSTKNAVVTPSTLQILKQPDDHIIERDEQVSLLVTINQDTNITYQWYQGKTGDTSLAVGDNAAQFTTPALTETTNYWVAVNDGTTTLNSRTVVISLKDTVLTGNGIGVDSTGQARSSNANVVGLVTITPDEPTHIDTVEQSDMVYISSHVRVDTQHVGEIADILLVGLYTNGEHSQFYMRDGDIWVFWSGDMSELVAAQTEVILPETLDVPIYAHNFNNLAGKFLVYTGYRLKEDLFIVYGTEPTKFSVNE